MNERMMLEAKGPVRPVPVLNGYAETVSLAVQYWLGVIAATHWHLYRPTEVNGADFYVGTEECGHIHLDGEVHLATSLELRKSRLAHGLARPVPYYASWGETSIRNEAEAKHAIWLFRLNYDRIMGKSRQSMNENIAITARRLGGSPKTPAQSGA